MRHVRLTIALLAASCGCANALVLDWSNQSWTPNPSYTNSFDVDPSNPGNDVTISITGTTSDFLADPASGTMTPAVTTSLQGGMAAGSKSLEFATLFTDPQTVTVTITFAAGYTRGVQNVVFMLFDIDQGTRSDVIKNISATGADGSTYYPTITLGPTVSSSGVGAGLKLTGSADSPDTGAGSDSGNATLDFGATALTSVQFTFASTLGSPVEQHIALGGVSFTPVPEANPSAIAGALCACAAGLKLRRRKRGITDV